MAAKAVAPDTGGSRVACQPAERIGAQLEGWSEAGARRLLALRLLLLNQNWALLDRMRMVSVA